MIEEKELFKGVTDYVICSTLNQVVNYIPLKMIDACNQDENKNINIYNLTVEDKKNNKEDYKKELFKKFDNEKWDINFMYVIDRVRGFKSEIQNINIVNILNKVEYTNFFHKRFKASTKVIWNITGGQRTLMLSIIDFLLFANKQERILKGQEHYLIYLEGNSNQLYCGRVKQDGRLKFELMRNRYELKNLEIKTMLNLAGYDSNDNKNYLNQKEDEKQKYEEQFYTHLFDLYVSSLKKNDGRVAEILWELNVANPNIESIVNELVKYDKTNNYKWNVVESKKKNVKSRKEKREKEEQQENEIKQGNEVQLLNDLQGDSYYKFGYVLEKIVLYGIKKTINNDNLLKNYFIALYHSVKVDKLDYSHANKAINWHKDTKQLCEFDVVLLSKTGQLVVFECKTGDMKSDVGKARVYTAYATNGVYAKPILITPFGENEIDKLRGKYAYNIGFSKKEENNSLITEHDKVVKAYRAALRSNLEVWGLDELEKRLKSLFADAIGGGSVGDNK